MKKVHVEFTAKNITENAGLILFGKFADKLNLKKMLDTKITIKRGANASYTMSDIIYMRMMGFLIGAEHLSHLLSLKYDMVINMMFNWKLFPDPSTFNKLFKRFNKEHCQELNEVEMRVRKKVWSKKWYRRITLDIDSMVIDVNADKEAAIKRNNPMKKRQERYHILWCLIAENHECLHHWFRSSSGYSVNQYIEFLKQCIDRIPDQVTVVLIRADSEFFNDQIVTFLETVRNYKNKKIYYLIKVKMENMNKVFETKRRDDYSPKRNVKVTQFYYNMKEQWTYYYCVRIRVNKVEKSALFPIPKHEYFCYLSNYYSFAWRHHKFYCKRTISKNWIQWCKDQTTSGTISTHHFWANSAIFQTCIFTYNLLIWMMWLLTKGGLKEDPKAIQNRFVHVAAIMVHMGRQWKLRLPCDYVFKKKWLEIEERISKLNFS